MFIQEPIPFTSKCLSNKISVPGLRYEVAESLIIGYNIWLNGPFSVGSHSGRNVFRSAPKNYFSIRNFPVPIMFIWTYAVSWRNHLSSSTNRKANSASDINLQDENHYISCPVPDVSSQSGALHDMHQSGCYAQFSTMIEKLLFPSSRITSMYKALHYLNGDIWLCAIFCSKATKLKVANLLSFCNNSQEGPVMINNVGELRPN